MLNLKIKFCCTFLANLNLQNLDSMSFGWFKSYLGPISGDRHFCPPPIVQERVKYLFYPTFDDRHIGCLGKISKMGLTCVHLYAYLAEVYLACGSVLFLKGLTILV